MRIKLYMKDENVVVHSEIKDVDHVGPNLIVRVSGGPPIVVPRSEVLFYQVTDLGVLHEESDKSDRAETH